MLDTQRPLHDTLLNEFSGVYCRKLTPDLSVETLEDTCLLREIRAGISPARSEAASQPRRR